MIERYIIDPSRYDWGQLLAPWHDLLPREVTVWIVNKIGDLILVFEDGSVNLFDVAAGQVRRLADDRDQFAEALDDERNANEWLAIPLVEQAEEAGKHLRPGQLYSFIVPPILGGDYSLENLAPVDAVEAYGVLGEVYRQTKDLADGTRVILSVSR